MIRLICAYCKNPFEVPLYRKLTAKTCKKDCHNFYMSEKMTKYKFKKRHSYKIITDYVKIYIENNNVYFLIDKEDLDKVIPYRWHLVNHNGAYYVECSYREKRKQYRRKLHRYLMNIEDPKVYIDHINGNVFDNRKSNLRIATHYQNMVNQKINSKNTSGYKGVYQYKNGKQKNKPFYAYINFEKKRKYLGYFSTAIEAAKAYNTAALKYFGEFARLNKI